MKLDAQGAMTLSWLKKTITCREIFEFTGLCIFVAGHTEIPFCSITSK
jgi:hypothetical protein